MKELKQEQSGIAELQASLKQEKDNEIADMKTKVFNSQAELEKLKLQNQAIEEALCNIDSSQSICSDNSQ